MTRRPFRFHVSRTPLTAAAAAAASLATCLAVDLASLPGCSLSSRCSSASLPVRLSVLCN